MAKKAQSEEQSVPLSPREREVLQALSLGLSTKELAQRLDIEPVTVRNHVQNILRGLRMHTKTEAVIFAFRNGLEATGQAVRERKAKTKALDAQRKRLSPREMEVLRELADGKKTKEIAKKFNIEYVTTRNHIQNMLRKLKVHSKLQAVVHAYREGLLTHHK